VAEAQCDRFPDERHRRGGTRGRWRALQGWGRHRYSSLCIQPVIVLAADQQTLSAIHRRALERQVPHGLYIEEMFSTGHDAANRAVFAQHSPEMAKVVGIALREDKKLVDKITKGAKMHA
jgi:hypothetical protein